MKILHTSDWHLGKVIYGRSMLEDQIYFIDNIFIKALLKEKPDLVIIAGDIFDRSIAPVEAIRVFDKLIKRMYKEFKIPLAIITGNHDSADRIAIGTEILKNKGIYIASNILDVKEPIKLKSENEEVVNVYLLPFFEPAQIRDYYNDDSISGFNDSYDKILSEVKGNLNKDNINILVSHCFVTGCSVSESENPIYVGLSGEVSSEIFKGFDYTALGHLHKSQKVLKNVYYSGSPLAYSFDECSLKKSMNIIDIENKDISVRKIFIEPLHKLREICGTFKDIVEEAKKTPSKDYISIKLTDDKPIYMPIEQLRVYYPNIMTLRNDFLNNKSDEDKVLQLEYKNKINDREFMFKKFMEDICDIKIDADDIEIFKEAEKKALEEEKI